MNGKKIIMTRMHFTEDRARKERKERKRTERSWTAARKDTVMGKENQIV